MYLLSWSAGKSGGREAWVEPCSPWVVQWDLLGVIHWRGQHSSEKLVVLFAIFLVLPGQEVGSEHGGTSFGPTSVPSFPWKKKRETLSSLHILWSVTEHDWIVFQAFLPLWDREDQGSEGKELLKLMGSVRATYRPSRPWTGFKGYREESLRSCKHQACHNLFKHDIAVVCFKVKSLHLHLQYQESGILRSLIC